MMRRVVTVRTSRIYQLYDRMGEEAVLDRGVRRLSEG